MISKAKLSKKARKKLNAEKRTTWTFSPVTRRVESKKIYNRKKSPGPIRKTVREIFDRVV